eukprot:226122-Pleurochrysis_carterae.AAC.2
MKKLKQATFPARPRLRCDFPARRRTSLRSHSFAVAALLIVSCAHKRRNLNARAVRMSAFKLH